MVVAIVGKRPEYCCRSTLAFALADIGCFSPIASGVLSAVPNFVVVSNEVFQLQCSTYD